MPFSKSCLSRPPSHGPALTPSWRTACGTTIKRAAEPQMPKRPIADVLIAAFADRFQGIITRNAAHFRNIAPALTIVEP
jgi:predicted nucleic acid-binding protein